MNFANLVDKCSNMLPLTILRIEAIRRASRCDRSGLHRSKGTKLNGGLAALKSGLGVYRERQLDHEEVRQQ